MRYDIKLEIDEVMVVVNEDYFPKDSFITENDVVVFIPPVSGG